MRGRTVTESYLTTPTFTACATRARNRASSSLLTWSGSPAANSEPLTRPNVFGARASKLTALLLKGHEDVKLSEEDMERLITWMDANALFYGTFDPEDQKRQQRGERIDGPALE